MDEEYENCSWKTIDKVVLIKLQLHEKVSLERTNLWNTNSLFAMLMTPEDVDGNLHRQGGSGDLHSELTSHSECSGYTKCRYKVVMWT